ncbi:hypothetical protein KIN20_031948, partial [Parelaphostrongylus tenuis]
MVRNNNRVSRKFNRKFVFASSAVLIRQQKPVDGMMNELMKIRAQGTDSEAVDRLIAEMRSKATCDDVVVVEWGGLKSTVDDVKARQVVQGWQQVQNELAQCQTAKERCHIGAYFVHWDSSVAPSFGLVAINPLKESTPVKKSPPSRMMMVLSS